MKRKETLLGYVSLAGRCWILAQLSDLSYFSFGEFLITGKVCFQWKLFSNGNFSFGEFWITGVFPMETSVWITNGNFPLVIQIEVSVGRCHLEASNWRAVEVTVTQWQLLLIIILFSTLAVTCCSVVSVTGCKQGPASTRSWSPN